MDITGSVAFPARGALPAGAVLVIRVQDTSRADAPAFTLAEQRIELAGLQVPIPFKLTVDRDLLRKNARITVAARIQRGSTLLFINDTSYPALIDGQPRHVEMVLKPGHRQAALILTGAIALDQGRPATPVRQCPLRSEN